MRQMVSNGKVESILTAGQVGPLTLNPVSFSCGRCSLGLINMIIIPRIINIIPNIFI